MQFDMQALLRTFCLSDAMAGYEVDGPFERIGEVKSVSGDGGWAVVATGRFLGRLHVIPASAVRRVDPRRGAIHVDLTRTEVDRSPEHDGRGVLNAESARILRSYYGRLSVCLFLPL